MSNWRIPRVWCRRLFEWKFNLLKYSYLRFGFSSLLNFVFALSVTLDCCCLTELQCRHKSTISYYNNMHQYRRYIWKLNRSCLSISCEPTITIDGEGEIQLLSGDDEIFFFFVSVFCFQNYKRTNWSRRKKIIDESFATCAMQHSFKFHFFAQRKQCDVLERSRNCCNLFSFSWIPSNFAVLCVDGKWLRQTHTQTQTQPQTHRHHQYTDKAYARGEHQQTVFVVEIVFR